MVLLSRWSYYRDGLIIEMVLLSRWSYYRDGPIIEVVLLSRWSYYGGMTHKRGSTVMDNIVAVVGHFSTVFQYSVCFLCLLSLFWNSLSGWYQLQVSVPSFELKFRWQKVAGDAVWQSRSSRFSSFNSQSETLLHISEGLTHPDSRV